MTEPDRERHRVRDVGTRVARVAPLVGLAGQTAGEAVVASLRARRGQRGRPGQDGPGGQRDHTELHTRAADRYAERLGRSRGVLMKAGQLLSFVTFSSTVESGYREIYQNAFARLQQDAPPMPAQDAIETVESELGVGVTEAFADFDPHPLAAASIGQVHAATMPDGRRVAVKIQYPGVDTAIRADLANTELLTTFLEMARAVVPGLTAMDMRAMGREIAERIGEEVDYDAEAASQRALADAYRGHPFIHVPEVVPERSGRRILTMDLVEGLRYEDACRAPADLRDQWGEAIFRFVVGNLRRLRLFVADPHPGNYRFHPDGTVTFLDFGCMKRFPPEQVRIMQEIVRAAVAQDADRILAVCVAGGFVDGDDPPQAAELLAWWSESLRPLMAEQPFTYTPELAAELVQREFSLTGPHRELLRKLTAPSDYVLMSRIDTGMTSVLGGLRATGPWDAIRAEYDDGAPPATAFGAADAAFRGAGCVRP